MNDGDAVSWKEQLMEDAQNKALAAGTKFDFGTYANFRTGLNEAFSPFDAPGEALEKMKALQMKTFNSIDDHIAKFKMLVTGSKLGTTSPATIDYFRQSLTERLQQRILTLETVPKILDEWYEWATKLDHQWKKMRLTMGKSNVEQRNTSEGNQRRFTFPRTKDPNAMDINASSTNEQNQLMKEGKCFGCKKIGHISKNCPDKKVKKEEPKKYKGKELHTHIRGLFKDMTADEKEEFMKAAEEAGF